MKAGFLVSARAGSGIVIARLPDGCKLFLPASDLVVHGHTGHWKTADNAAWSPPSAIGIGGVGFGGQMGAE